MEIDKKQFAHNKAQKKVEVEKTLTKKMLDEVSLSHYHESVNLETDEEYHEREKETARKKKEEKER